jgi:uncharacterized RDD family membrane protein YckC
MQDLDQQSVRVRGNSRTNPAVYYSAQDLAGFARRSAALTVDLLIVFFACGGVVALGPDVGLPQSAANAIAFGLAWIYLAGLKSRPARTIGYRVTGLELVDLYGKRASLWLSTCRFLFLFGGPLNFAFDLIWLTNDPNRQTMRDKLCGTYVVRRGAQPTGTGVIRYPTYFVATMSLVLPEVVRTPVDSGPFARGISGPTD